MSLLGAIKDPQFWRDVNTNAQGLLGQPIVGLNQTAGLLSGALTPTEFATIRGQQAVEQLLPPALTTLYHGSPFQFSTFDLSKAGSGEGTAAYGHGAYFTPDRTEAAAYGRNVYQTEAPGNVLDIHAPMSEQPERVKAALRNIPGRLGGDAYGNLAQALGSQQAASAYLKANGVDGLKYGAPTKGYVLFDPILK